MLALFDVRAAVAWWVRDPDAPALEPVMVATRIGQRDGDGATTCTLLDPPPRRGRVVLHAVLPPGADRYRVAGVLWSMCREANRRVPGLDWACYVTAGRLVGWMGYVSTNPRHPVIAAVADMPRRPTRALPGPLHRAAHRELPGVDHPVEQPDR